MPVDGSETARKALEYAVDLAKQTGAPMLLPSVIDKSPYYGAPTIPSVSCDQPVRSTLVKAYADLKMWADVFRRIGLDERDHMNSSFVARGEPERVARYDGMPILRRGGAA
jgi:nucleotide-binding universal stress UspA family protein